MWGGRWWKRLFVAGLRLREGRERGWPMTHYLPLATFMANAEHGAGEDYLGAAWGP